VTKAALPVLRRSARVHFIQISSIGGAGRGYPRDGRYQTAKFAVEGFSEVLSNELRPLGIKVTNRRAGGVSAPTGRFVDAHAPVSKIRATVGEMNATRRAVDGQAAG